MNYLFICIQVFFVTSGFLALYLVMCEKNLNKGGKIILFVSCAIPIVITIMYFLGQLFETDFSIIIAAVCETIILGLVMLYKNTSKYGGLEYEILENINEGVLLVDSKFKHLYSNERAKEILSEYISQGIESDDKKIEELFVYTGNVIKYKEHNYELRISEIHNNNINGYIAWLLDVSDFVEHNREISHLKENAENATKAKDDFLANMSHEIRTPMNAIYGMAELLSESDMSPVEKEYINTIKNASTNLLKIINDILDFSKIESGKIELLETNYELRDIIEEVSDVISSRAAKANLRFIINIQPDIPLKFNGDDKRIKQMLINLLNNAVKFTEKGEISLTVSCDNIQNGVANLKFAIKDSGIGIKKADINKIFVKFEQVDTKRNRGIEGTGLGLPLSKRFANLMGGDITVDSEYGKGSCFTISIKQKIISDDKLFKGINIKEYYFKVCESDKYYKNAIINALNSINASYKEVNDVHNICSADSMLNNIILYEYKGCNIEPEHKNVKSVAMINFFDHVDNESENITYIKKPISLFKIEDIITGKNRNKNENIISFIAPDAKIVVVDDNDVNLKVAEGLMKKFGFEPELLSSGYDLLNNLRNNTTYDIIFIDHMMPGIDGVETVRLIRKMPQEYAKNAVIIALTANAIKGTEKEFKEAGMNDTLFKPIIFSELRDILEKYLPKKKILYDNVQEIYNSADGQIPEIEGLDVKGALQLIGGSIVDYQAVLYNFYKAIDKKIELLKSYVKEENIKSYTIEVHALKSASKLIGAYEMADLAAYLEQCGKEKSIYQIKSKTEEFLNMLRKYKHIIYPYVKDEEKSEDEKENVGEDKIHNILCEIEQAIEDYDIMKVDDGIKKLKRYKLSEKRLELLGKLDDAIDNVDFEKCLSIISEMK